MRNNDYVIIMAGGIGSRFWPMSRASLPKQFHDILGTGKTLIRMTFERFEGFIPNENIFVVTNQRYKALVMEQIPELDESQILLEPVGRNTAPCIAYGAFKIRKRNPNAGIMVAASDHLIVNTANFQKDIGLGLDHVVKEDVIMTIGIRPTRPDTGYGYIQYLEDQGGEGYYKVKTFTEKPALEIARNFLRSGDFLWNSGMFLFSTKTILDGFLEFLPDMHDLFNGISDDLDTDKEDEQISDIYAKCRNISIDYGIMEHAENVYAIPSSFDWSDLGTWVSLHTNMDKDYLGNAVKGNVIAFNSANNMIRIDDHKKLVVLNGLNDFIVVDTGDVLLICPQEDEQKIKEIVSEVKKNHGETFT